MMFQADGPIWRILSTLGDMVILHLLWLICCIPIVTIGPATAAAHYVTLKLVRDEGRSVTYMFFKSFKKNFKQGMVLGLIFTAAGLVLGLDFYLCLNLMEGSSSFKLAMLAALAFLAIIYLIEMMYLWAVLACFENTLKQTVLNAFFIAMSHFGDTSVMLAQDLLLAVGAVLCFAFLPQVAILFVIFGFPLFFMVNSFRLVRIFEKYQPENRCREEDR